jgi:hypothetical protein
MANHTGDADPSVIWDVKSNFPDPDLQIVTDFNMNDAAGKGPDVKLRLHMDIDLSTATSAVIGALQDALRQRNGNEVLRLLGLSSATAGSGVRTLRAALGLT